MSRVLTMDHFSLHLEEVCKAEELQYEHNREGCIRTLDNIGNAQYNTLIIAPRWISLRTSGGVILCHKWVTL